MNVQGRITVTAAEFTRQFGHLRHARGDGPVHITHHGRETHVLVAAERYEELRRRSVESGRAEARSKLAVFVDWLDHGVLVLDAHAQVVLANSAAHAMLGLVSGELADQAIWDAVPALTNSLVGHLLRHALEAGEPASADLPAPIRPDRWWQVAVHPDGREITVLLRDITDQVRRCRIADEPGAAAAAVAAHPGVGRIRLNPRGHIDDADAAFCALVGLSAQRLNGVALVDLVPMASKAAVRAALEQVIGEAAEPVALASVLLTNTGRSISVNLALAGLHGAYGAAGAVALVTTS